MVSKRGDLYVYKGKIEVLETKTTKEITGKVSGLITDIRTGEVIKGANVAVVGEARGTFTNEKGEFEFIETGEFTLRFSFVGNTALDETFNVSPGQQIKVAVQLGTTIIHEKKEKTTANNH